MRRRTAHSTGRSIIRWIATGLLSIIALGALLLAWTWHSENRGNYEYHAVYAPNLSFSGFIKTDGLIWYDSLVYYNGAGDDPIPDNCPLTLIVNGRRLRASELTPDSISILGGHLVQDGPRFANWEIACPDDASQFLGVRCTFNKNGQPISLSVVASEGGPCQKTLISLSASLPASLPLSEAELEKHFGQPLKVTRVRRFP